MGNNWRLVVTLSSTEAIPRYIPSSETCQAGSYLQRPTATPELAFLDAVIAMLAGEESFITVVSASTSIDHLHKEWTTLCRCF